MRLDKYMCSSGLADSRTRAAELIKAGLVTVNGRRILKPSFEADIFENVKVTGSIHEYVGRGGMKLERAMDYFNISCENKKCVDIGASTGGFTDCLLKRGADEVWAIDSGHGQLAEKLRGDRRVNNLEGFNARNLSVRDIGGAADIAVCDVSFISQTYIHSNVYEILADGGYFITLIKPQFECGRNGVGKNGIVKNDDIRRKAVLNVLNSLILHSLRPLGVIRSPIPGGDGNIEYLTSAVKCCVGEISSELNADELLRSIDKVE